MKLHRRRKVTITKYKFNQKFPNVNKFKTFIQKTKKTVSEEKTTKKSKRKCLKINSKGKKQ